MKVCDICKNPSIYSVSVIYESPNRSKGVDLCRECYETLREKENKYRYMAYEELLNERGCEDGCIKPKQNGVFDFFKRIAKTKF